MNTCLHCGKETTNTKYCSRSCSAKVNNTLKPKKIYKCRDCDFIGVKRKHALCEDCRALQDYSISDVIYTKHHKSSAFALIRTRARSVLKSRGASCEHCGYYKHVEVCHIKPISSFGLDTKLSVVNDDSNLLVLCPNCHWEFDHSL